VHKPASELKTYLCLGYDIPREEQVRKYISIDYQNYQAIVEGLNIGVIFQDKDGFVISANQKIAEILDTTLENLYNNNKIYSVWNTCDGNGVPLHYSQTPFMKALVTGEPQTNVILRLQMSESQIRTVICNSQPLFEHGHPKPFSVVSTVLDITNEKNLEQEAKARGALFSSFMEHTPYFTWIVDKEENLVFANHSLLSFFQADESAFGQKIAGLIPGPIEAAFHEKHLKVMKTQRVDHSIIKSLMADGKEHVYQITVFPIHGASIEVMIGGEALDVTESYNARQEIKKTNERLLNLSRPTSEAIWDWNMTNHQIFVNETLQSLIGNPIREAADLAWFFQRVYAEDRAKIEDLIKTALKHKKPSWDVEFRFRDAAGKYIDISNRGFVIYNAEGPIRMIGSMRDISEFRKIESQLVDQRLKQQKGIAEAIIHSQEEERRRIGNELHDNVNQILSTAQLYISMLDNSLENFAEIRAKSLETIKLGIEEIRKLSRQMVAPSLREGGLVASINQIVDELQYINPFHITFTHSKTCAIEALNKNKKMTLFRIVQEQIKNTVKYSKAKKVEINLCCTHDQIRLFIEDDGVGFDSKNTRRGLGLSNIYERTRLYNGKITLDTAVGKGCSLTVTIPLETKRQNLVSK